VFEQDVRLGKPCLPGGISREGVGGERCSVYSNNSTFLVITQGQQDMLPSGVHFVSFRYYAFKRITWTNKRYPKQSMDHFANASIFVRFSCVGYVACRVCAS
jgi:hypothetical protein